MYDSTASDALENYAARMSSELVPAGLEWMELEAGTDIPEDKMSAVNDYLTTTTSTVFAHIDSSNFSSQIYSSFMDLGVSTGAIIIEAGDGVQSSLNFRSVPLNQ